jgi:hypothetical protein
LDLKIQSIENKFLIKPPCIWAAPLTHHFSDGRLSVKKTTERGIEIPGTSIIDFQI